MFRKIGFFILLIPFCVNGQRIDVDVFGGISNYQGDLKPSFFTMKNANPSGAVILKVGFSQNIFLRTGFSFGSVAGYDMFNRQELKPRNLNFRSALREFHAGIEYRFINADNFNFTPYVFVAGGVFQFNPFTYDNNLNRVFLRPLSTEGQGLDQFPDRKPYNLTQFCIPYGGGIKWQINCNLNIGAEFRHTKTFTDYLDDVSTTYVDEDVLRAARGQMAVDFAWKRDDFDGRPYPNEGTGRGNPSQKDWYYFAGLTIGLKLNDCETGEFTLGGLLKTSGGKGLFGRRGRGGSGSTFGGSKSTRKKLLRQLKCPD